MQTELEKSEYWEGKRLQEARESAMKNTIGLLDVAERLGLLKGKYLNLEDFFEAYNGAVNQMVDMILKNINLKSEIKSAKELATGSEKDIEPTTIEVTNGEKTTKELKDNLKTLGYKWSQEKICWYKTYYNFAVMRDELASNEGIFSKLTINKIKQSEA
jgi:hypothetical protein